MSVFLIYEAFCGFPAFPGFRFLPWSIFENPESTENFRKHVFRGTKTIYLISSTFLDILCIQDTSFKVLLKVINDYLLLKLEIGFSCC